MVKDQEFLKSKASYCLDLAKKMGATDASVTVGHSISETVNFRNKSLEASDRSDGLALSIETYLGKRRSSISSSNLLDENIKTLIELGLHEKDLFISDNTKQCYHPGRSGSINLKSEKGPHLAYFGELHPAIIKKLDFKEPNIYGLEIFLKNIPEPNKKIRQTKKSFQPSDFQKSQRDFAFVIDKIFKIGLLEKIIKEIDYSLIQEVTTFDVYEGDNIPKDKKSVAINVTLQSPNKTLSEKDIDQISKKIIDVVKEKTGATIRS